jgi:Flp pilus assembly CpaE family ATPase
MLTKCGENPRAWRALLVCPNPELRHVAETVLVDLGLGEVLPLAEYPSVCDISSLVSECQVCFLDASCDVKIALRLLARFARANTSVIILHPLPDPDLTVECLRRGASHVMEFPREKEQLRSILDHVAARRYYSSQPVPLPGAFYGMMAGKGASGSTTTATQVATRIAAMRPRKTLLVDLDGISGSMAFLFRKRPTFSILDMAANLTRIDEDLLETMVVEVGPLDVLFAPAKPVSLQISVPELLRIIEFLRSVYDCVIVDLPSYCSAFSVEVARAADLLMLVTTCEVSAIHSTVRTISYLEQCGVSSMKVLLNRYRQATVPSKSLDAALGHKVFAHICEAEKMFQRAVLDGIPVPTNSKYSSDIAAIAQRLTGWPMATDGKPTPKFAPMRLFKRLGTGRIRPSREILSIRPAASES